MKPNYIIVKVKDSFRFAYQRSQYILFRKEGVRVFQYDLSPFTDSWYWRLMQPNILKKEPLQIIHETEKRNSAFKKWRLFNNV